MFSFFFFLVFGLFSLRFLVVKATRRMDGKRRKKIGMGDANSLLLWEKRERAEMN